MEGAGDSPEGVLILLLNKLPDGLPHAEALRPLLYLLMGLLGEVVGHGGLGHGVGGLVGGAPKDLQGAPLHLRQYLLQALQAGDGDILVQPGDHAGGAVGHHRLGVAGDAQFAALAVDVAVDQAGDQVAALRLDDLGVRPDVGGHVPHGGNHVAVDGHIGGVDLTGHNVDQLPAADDLVGGELSASGADTGFQVGDGSLHGVIPPQWLFFLLRFGWILLADILSF